MFVLSMWEFSSITHDWGAAQLMLPQALRGMGQQFCVAPVVTLALGALPPARLKLASGLFNLMRNLGGAIGIAACATILNDRTNLHFQRLADHLNFTNEALNGWVAGHLDATGRISQLALRQLWNLTFREAQTLTFADSFLIIGACFAAALVLVPLMHKIAPPPQPSADAH